MKKKIKTELLRQKISDKWTDEAIGNLFGVTRQAVFQYRKRLNIPKVYNRHEKRNLEIARFASKGIKIKEIALKFNLSVFQIYHILKKIGK